MPELPEVEVIRRGLLPHVKGRRIKEVRFSGKKLRTDVPIELMQKKLPGAKVDDICRRAKYLLFLLDSDDLLIIHLGMTGKLGVCKKDLPSLPHDHLFFLFTDGTELRYNDTRRFGSVRFIEQEQRALEEELFFRTTGPEPFDPIITPQYFRKLAKGSSQAVKTFIMNGKNIAGVGNIYANESLFAAGVHPHLHARRVTLGQWQKIIHHIRTVLREAIACGGSTISDFLNAGGEQGYFQMNFRVYGRAEKPCTVCSTPLKKTAITGRASYHCPRCQKR
jgi:formamidopyrimidine-DNA glycosylase